MSSFTVTWDARDVQKVRIDLTYEQASEVLQFIKSEYTKKTGLNSKTLKAYADFYFPLERS